MSVFVSKLEMMSMPNIVPRTEDIPKRQKLPKDLGNAVFPRGMVAHLLKILVPEESLKRLQVGKNLPELIFNVIKG